MLYVDLIKAAFLNLDENKLETRRVTDPSSALTDGSPRRQDE